MKININSIELEKGKTQKGFRLSLTSDNHPDKTFYYFGESELDYLIQCCKGEAKFYPYFDDGLYLLKVYPQGIHCVYSNSNESYYFTFPANELIPFIQVVQSAIETESEYYENLTNLIPKMKREYSPNVLVIWGNDDVEKRFYQDIQSPLLENPDYAKTWLADRIRHAESYSDGNLIKLHIVFDRSPLGDLPTDYYWQINSDDKRIYNGGFIAHKRTNNDGKITYQYSTHT